MDKIRILVAGDDLIIAEDLERSLKSIEYEVTAKVTTGSDALSQIEKDPPDLVLMDIKLKGQMNGIETSDRIWARFGIPVVYIMGYADKKILEKVKAPSEFDAGLLRMAILFFQWKIMESAWQRGSIFSNLDPSASSW